MPYLRFHLTRRGRSTRAHRYAFALPPAWFSFAESRRLPVYGADVFSTIPGIPPMDGTSTTNSSRARSMHTRTREYQKHANTVVHNMSDKTERVYLFTRYARVRVGIICTESVGAFKVPRKQLPMPHVELLKCSTYMGPSEMNGGGCLIPPPRRHAINNYLR